MKAENDEGFIVVRKILQVLVKMSHRGRHNNGNHKVGNAVFVDGKGNDLIRLVRVAESVDARDNNIQ